MTNQPEQTIYVEYCRSCETHSWCTHHDQAKYHEHFLRLAEIIAERHPQLEVIGNMVPANLIPFKIAQNKYIDANTNKYVVYPQIGSFEVFLNDTLLFSKKQNNAWPNLHNLLDKITYTIDPNSPLAQPSPSKSKESNKVKSPAKYKAPTFVKSHDEKKSHYKDTTKGFTLTDHFKLYREKQQTEEKEWMTQKYQSEGSAKQISDISRGQSREKSQGSDSSKVTLKDLAGDTRLKEMLKNKGLIVKDHGKKEMIIKLDSIEEQNANYDDNGITQRTAQKSKKREKIRELQDAFSSLENKFINFETKVQDIHSKKNDFEYNNEQSEEHLKSRRRGHQKRQQSIKIQEKSAVLQDQSLIDRSRKMDQYVNSSEQEKNEKLHRIYGQWKLLKQTASKNKRMLKNKYRAPFNQPESDGQTSINGSQNSQHVITFKPKNKNHGKQQKKGNHQQNDRQENSRIVNNQEGYRSSHNRDSGVIRNNRNNFQKQTTKNPHNSLQQHIHEVLSSKPKTLTTESQNYPVSNMQQEYSGLNNNQLLKSRTEELFYKGKLKKQHIHQQGSEDYQQSESQHPVARLIKNKGNAMSVEAFRHHASQPFKEGREQHLQGMRQHKNRIQNARHGGQSGNETHHKAHKNALHSRDKNQMISHGGQSGNKTNYKAHKNGQHSRDGSQMIGNPSEASTQKVSKDQNPVQMSQFSNNARQNINKIQKRMSKLQARLSKHKQIPNVAQKEKLNRIPYSVNKLRNGSQSSRSQSSNSQAHFNNKRYTKEASKNPRNNHTNSFASKKKSQRQRQNSHASNVSSKRTDKYGHNSPFKHDELAIEEENSDRESNIHTPQTHRSKQFSEFERDEEKRHITTRVTHHKNQNNKLKKYPTNYHPRPKHQEINRHNSDLKHHSQKQSSRSNSSEREEEESEHERPEDGSKSHRRQNSTRVKKYELHEPVTFLRKQKEWKGTDPSQLRKPSSRLSKQAEEEPSEEETLHNNSSFKPEKKEKQSDSRVSRVKKASTFRSKSKQPNSPKKEENPTVIVSKPGKKDTSYGSIKKNSYKKKANSKYSKHSKQSKNSPPKKQKSNLSQNKSEHGSSKMSASRSQYSSEMEQSQSNQTNRKNKKMLKYYKSVDYCYEGKDGEKMLSNEKVEGWKMNSDNSDSEMEADCNSEYEDHQQECASTNRRNSLDKELEGNENTDKVVTQQVTPIKKERKRKQPKVEYSCEEVICKQYSEYLRLRIAEEMSKSIPAAHASNKQYEDEECIVNVNYCPSIDSIQAPVPESFMDYNPSQAPEELSLQSKSEEAMSQKEGDETIIAAAPILINNSSQPSSLVHIEATSPKLETLDSDNNVYGEAVDPKHREVGIQKEFMVEASIQTEQEGLASPVLMARTNTIHSNHSQNSNHKQSSPKGKVVSAFNKQNMDLKKSQIKGLERAHIIDKIYSNNMREEVDKLTSAHLGNKGEVAKQTGDIKPLAEIYPQNVLLRQQNIGTDQISTKFNNLLKVVDILCEKSEWLVTRLFEDPKGVMTSKAFGVWLCNEHQWECVLVDSNAQVDKEGQPLFSKHKGNQTWFNVLEKAIAHTLGGYEALSKADSSLIFTMMTGCNAIPFKIKEDLSKSGKMLSLIADCLRKNYVIHATKNFDKNKVSSRQHVYYINSIRRGNEEETLIQMSQDGRESFWVKLSKFVQEFTKIDILQLRINHNFAHVDIGTPRPGQLTVIQLQFHQEGQGCVTLAYLGQTGNIRAFLYKQEKNKLLKLVGQAKEKQKSSLFFECNFTDGKYFIFAQAESIPLRMSYLGEGQPTMSVTEEILSDGLKNDLAEYLPVNQNTEGSKFRKTEQSLCRSSKGRFKDRFVEQYLKQNFVEYMMGRSRKN